MGGKEASNEPGLATLLLSRAVWEAQGRQKTPKDTKMTPKCHQNDTKMTSELYQNHVKTTPSTTTQKNKNTKKFQANTIQSVSQPASQPVNQSVCRSVSQSISQSVSQPASQLASQPVIRSLRQGTVAGRPKASGYSIFFDLRSFK